MTRQAFIYKWTEYALAFFLFFVLETVVFRRLPVGGVLPLLSPLCVAAVAVFETPLAGAGFGLAAGVLWEAACWRTMGITPLCFTGVGLLSGLITQSVFNRSLTGCCLCSLAGLGLLEAVRLAWAFVRGWPMGTAAVIAGGEVLYSIFFVLPIYFVFRGVYHRVGGDRLV